VAVDADTVAEGEDVGNGGVSFGAELDFNTRYVWRGLALSQTPVVQPSLWATKGRFTAGVFANSVLGKGQGKNGLNEVDLYLTYLHDKKWLHFEPSLTYYLYLPDGFPTTGEVILELTRRLKRFDVVTTHNFDVMRYKGAYYGDVQLAHNRAVNERLDVTTSVGVGWGSSRWNNVNVGVRGGGLNVATAGVSARYQLNKNFYLRPHLEVSSLRGGRLRQAVDKPDLVNIGVAFGSEF
jgi:hypothetical protein